MKKNIVKLNETQLKKIVAESVKKVLNESQAEFFEDNSLEFKSGWWSCFEDVSGFLSDSDAAGLLEDKGITKEDVDEALQNRWITNTMPSVKMYLAQIGLQYYK